MKKSPNTNLTADIVVVGAGGAGLAAAITAAEHGTNRITVLEARSAPGGNSIFAEGFFAINSQNMDPANMQHLKDDLFKSTMRYTHHRANPRLIRILIDESESTLRWLTAKGIGFEWRGDLQHTEIPLYASYTNKKIKAGAVIIKTLAQECRNKGIPILCNTRARKMLTDDNGKVAGILAVANQDDLKISTKSIVLASGGFAGNKKLLKKYFPSFTDDVHIAGVPNQGDGIQIADEVGADTDDTLALEMEGPIFPWTRKLNGNFILHPYTVWINNQGERFTEEQSNPFLCANALCRQPGKVSYTIFDEEIKNRIFKEAPKEDFAWCARLDKLIRIHTEKGRIKIADLWDEIAAWIGVSPETLGATIEEYNSSCCKGYDSLFSKEPANLIPLHRPPYYAIRCYPSLMVTHGGIRISSKMEVMNKCGKSIQGLYAAGVETGGVDSDTYTFSLPGHSFGFALNTGRIAGKAASEYVTKNIRKLHLIMDQ